MVTAIATSLRNSFRDAVATALDGGSVDVYAGATLLVNIPLGATPFTAGSASLSLTASHNGTAIAGSSSTPTSADWKNSSAAVLFSVTSGLAGAELIWSVEITAGQTCTLASYTLTFPAS